jgi:hypothetical protein
LLSGLFNRWFNHRWFNHRWFDREFFDHRWFDHRWFDRGFFDHRWFDRGLFDDRPIKSSGLLAMLQGCPRDTTTLLPRYLVGKRNGGGLTVRPKM